MLYEVITNISQSASILADARMGKRIDVCFGDSEEVSGLNHLAFNEYFISAFSILCYLIYPYGIDLNRIMTEFRVSYFQLVPTPVWSLNDTGNVIFFGIAKFD